MSFSNDNKAQRRPGPSPVHRKRYLDPALETTYKRRETDRSMNARFDRMVETMSVMHSRPESPKYSKKRKRSGRSYSLMDDAYSLPSARLKNGLSFVKMDATTSSSSVFSDARHSHSSDSVEVSRGSIPLESPCNSLPEWLANTFMSLSKKHPLRLLLPPDMVQAIPEDPSGMTMEGTEAGLFGFMKLPTPKYESPDEHDPDIHKITSCTNSAVVTGVLLDSKSSDPGPLPFSTPGPGSSLAGISRTTPSTLSLRTGSSPTLFDSESHLPEQKSSHQDINHPSMALTPIHHCDSLQINELYLHADNPYLSQIHATPGPRYRPSGVEDPLSLELESDATPSRLTTDDDLIDFRWRPFDRKRLVAPVLKAPAFADDGRRSTIINAGRPPLATSQTPNASKLEALSPFSPSPFSFSPLDHGEADVSAIDPESQDHSKDTIMKTPPLQLLRSATPAISRAPLSLPVGRTSGSLSLAECGTSKFQGKELPKGKGSKYAFTEDLFTFHDGPDFGLPALDSVTTECD